MKKQTYYKAIISDKRKRYPNNIGFEKGEGYIFETNDKKGYPIKIALEYIHGHWLATEVTTGCSVPYRAELKRKEEIIEAIRDYDFASILYSPDKQLLALKLSEHIESEDNIQL